MMIPFNPDTSPPSFRNHLLRTRLLNTIEHQPKKLTLIQAPPGYGKTSFLKQVYDHIKQAHLWLNLRHSDNDPINLLHKLNAACLQLEGDAQSASEFTHTSGFTSPSIELWTRSLIDKLNKQTQLCIFLNDADFIQDKEACEIINRILQMTHSGIQIFMTASSSLSFSYSQLLLENQLINITQEALRFSKQDLQDMFSLQQKVIESDTIFDQLIALSEGWPAAAFYMASSLSSEDEITRFIDDAQLKQQAFDRYFIERVFEQQPEQTQQFLMKLSLLDRFNLDICQSLSESTQQWQSFWPYVENHTFITPIEASGKWYRFHQLFGLFLRHRCQLEFSEQLRTQWQEQAARCFHKENAIDEAIHLAIQAKSFEQAAIWMENAFTTVVVRMGMHITYHNWFNALPDQIIENHPRLRIGSIWAQLANRRFLNVAEQLQWLLLHKSRYSNDTQQEILRTAGLIHCCMEGLKDNATKAAPLIEDWLEKWNNSSLYPNPDDHHYEMGLALLIKGYCAKSLSEFKVSREAFHQSIHHLEAFGSFYGVTLVKSLLAVTYAKQGFHHEAMREAREGLHLARIKLGERSHNGFGLAALIAAIHYELDEVELARPLLKDILPYLKEQSPSDVLIAAFETQAHLLAYDQRIEEAIGFLKDAIKWSETQELNRLSYKLVDHLITLLHRQRRDAEAERYASEYNLILHNANSFNPDNHLQNLAARSVISCFWQRKAYDEANKVIDQLLERAERKGQLRRKAEWLKLKVLTHYFAKDLSHQDQLIEELLSLAQTQHYVRLMTDEPDLINVLTDYAKREASKSLEKATQQFYETLMQKIQPRDKTEPKELVEPLTTKEIEIVRLLSEGLPNKVIAEKLLVSLGTLKWHLHNIYNKLLVKNRTQALLEAKRLGYLTDSTE